MPYCPECGTRYEEMDPVCPSCGRDFPGIEPEREQTYPVNETVLKSEIPVEPSKSELVNPVEESPAESQTESSAVDMISAPHFAGESHLGKGVIKPQAVEQSLDGFHFKYDLPKRNFVKAEPIKEKPREYRVTSPEPEFNPAEEVSPPAIELPEEPIPVPEKTGIDLEPVEEPLKEEDIREEVKPVATDTVVENLPEEGSPPLSEPEPVIEMEDTEVIPEPVLPEPELEGESISETIWEGRQTWMKFPLGNVYRISDHSLIVFGKDNQKLYEVNLALITGIYLKQSWFAMLLGIGDLELKIRDFPAAEIVLGGIEQPHKVKQMLEKLCQSKL